MESEKYNKLVNTTKMKQTYRYREQTGGFQKAEAQYRRQRGNIGVGDSKAQTIMYKISYKDIFTAQGI